MLTLYVDQTDLPVEHDVEKLFIKTKIKDTELNRTLIEKIERGRYNDASTFIDRLGVKLYYDNLSTGCKAALCVANNPDKIVDTIECGHNARDAIIKYCREGKILYHSSGRTISSLGDSPDIAIDVVIGQYRFITLSRLNMYLHDELCLGYEPDLELEGVEWLG